MDEFLQLNPEHLNNVKKLKILLLEQVLTASPIHIYWIVLRLFDKSYVNPLDAGRRSTDFAQTPYAAGSLLTDGTVYERSGW